MTDFIHLRVHSEYSLLEGAMRGSELASACVKNGMPAVAITDSNNMFGSLELSEGLVKQGVQPIIGCQIGLALPSPAAPVKIIQDQQAPVVLLAQSPEGLNNLRKLNSCLYMGREASELTGKDAYPKITFPKISLEQLIRYNKGLICLTGAASGPLGKLYVEDREDEARSLLDALQQAFQDRLYIEIQRHNTADHETEPFLLKLAYENDIPLVATNDVHFLDRSTFPAQDAFFCIGQGAYLDQEAPRKKLTEEHYFKSGEEMQSIFSDLPEAIERTVEIARRCAARPYKHAPILPKFADDEVEELKKQAHAGLVSRLESNTPVAPREEYIKRLDFELGVIERMGFPGYFLIVADFIKWAKARSIPVGPGRGSGAGSLVAWALTITDLDPLRFNLLFERFLNPDRVSMPDFDIDFCMDRREEVIRYVQQAYGHDRVGQIITFGGFLSKMAVRDIGRVLQLPYHQVNGLSQLIPTEGTRPMSIPEALEHEPRLEEMKKKDSRVSQVLTYAEKLEGLLRNASTHAAGVVIGDRPLDELVPLYRDPKSNMPATQYNMKWVEEAGLVKFDFLGLKTLTVIQGAVNFLKAQGKDIDIDTLPFDDEKTFELYRSARTAAVFQVESPGMMGALRQMQPTCIEDIVALVALYRPGPMENIPQYCDVKNQRRQRASIHPLIDHILDETQGIIVYQEQVMQIAREMAGYTLGGADLLRRAMGKKIQAAMDAERPKFIEGAKQNGVPEVKAIEVWNLLDKFANYGFNKSHAAAYALISYQTAWLKAHHPAEFMAAVMNCDLADSEKLAGFVAEARRMKIKIHPPCVNRSQARFTVRDGEIFYGLAAVKGIGPEAIDLLVEGRKDEDFEAIYDLAHRVNLKKLGRRVLGMMARVGAFDAIHPNRKAVYDAVPELMAYSHSVHSAGAGSQGALFSGEDMAVRPEIDGVADWSYAERLEGELSALSYYLSGHPLEEYQDRLAGREVTAIRDLPELVHAGEFRGRLAGTVLEIDERVSAKKTRYAFVRISDPTGEIELRVFEDQLREISRDGKALTPGMSLVFLIEAFEKDERMNVNTKQISNIVDWLGAAEPGFKALRVTLSESCDIAALAEVVASSKKDSVDRRGWIELVVPASSEAPRYILKVAEDHPLSYELARKLNASTGVMAVETRT